MNLQIWRYSLLKQLGQKHPDFELCLNQKDRDLTDVFVKQIENALLENEVYAIVQDENPDIIGAVDDALEICQEMGWHIDSATINFYESDRPNDFDSVMRLHGAYPTIEIKVSVWDNHGWPDVVFTMPEPEPEPPPVAPGRDIAGVLTLLEWLKMLPNASVTIAVSEDEITVEWGLYTNGGRHRHSAHFHGPTWTAQKIIDRIKATIEGEVE
jgi:hypothetical protein